MVLDDHIRTVDRVVKDCDVTRKQLETLLRKLDDLYDEVKHFRDFITYEKQRRDPSLTNYKAPNIATGTDHISECLGELTLQFAKKLLKRKGKLLY